jgi:hypothetical protein
MSTTITGVVKNGVVVPKSPLPEGACIEIQMEPPRILISSEAKYGADQV